jgi:hypothetical protein
LAKLILKIHYRTGKVENNLKIHEIPLCWSSTILKATFDPFLFGSAATSAKTVKALPESYCLYH